jgi:YggT family protein
MSPFSQAGLLLVNSIGSLILLILLLRFLLQLVRADFYNPISQFVVRFSNPLLVPLRRMIPGFGGLDVASLVLAYGTQLILMAAILMVAGQTALPWMNLVFWALIGVFSLFVNIYFWGLLIMVIASWLAPNSYNPALILINQILDPVMRPIRRMMPDLGGLDLSPIVLMLTIQMVEILVIYPAAQASMMPKALAIAL